MQRKDLIYISTIVILVVVLIIISLGSYSAESDIHIKNKYIDSLNISILNRNKTIDIKTHEIDSLKIISSQTQITYEKNISNFYNTTIVSDDSISNYISKEIHNRK